MLKGRLKKKKERKKERKKEKEIEVVFSQLPEVCSISDSSRVYKLACFAQSAWSDRQTNKHTDRHSSHSTLLLRMHTWGNYS